MIAKKRKYHIYKYLLLYLVLFEAGTPVQTVYSREFILGFFCAAVSMFLLKQRISYKSGVVLALTGISIILTYSVNMDIHLTTAIMILSVMISAIIFSEFYTREEFENIYADLIFFLAAVSVVFYIIGRLFPDFVKSLPVFHGLNGDYPIVIGIFFYPCESNLYLSTLTRNNGIFREMGLFAMLLIWALCIMLQKNNDRYTITKIIITVAALITTFSTTGIVALIVLLPVLIKKCNKEIKKIGALGYILYIFVIAFGSLEIYQNRLLLFGKLNPENIDYGSFRIRYEGLIQDISLFISRPWGSGPTRYIEENTRSANAVSYFLGCFGLVTTLIIFLGFFLFMKHLDYSKGSKLLVIGAAILVLMTQGVYDYIIFYMFVIYGYVGHDKMRLKKNEYETKKNCNDQLFVQRI